MPARRKGWASVAEMLEFAFTSGETSDDGPALAVLNDRLYVAWIGSGNQNLNIMPSMDMGGGVVGFDSEAKRVYSTTPSEQGVQSLDGPALTSLTADGEPLLFMAWTYDGAGILEPGMRNFIYGAYFNESLAERGFLTALDDTSDHGPALTNWSNVNGVNTAWTGRGNNQLNTMHLLDSFSKTVSGETSPHRPALGNARWPNYTIYIAWTGEGDGELNTMSCNGDPFTGQPDKTSFDSVTKITYSGETSSSAPAIASIGKAVYLAWRGDPNNQINVMGIHQGTGDRHKETSGQTTGHHPAVAEFRGKLFVAWTGEDDHLNLAQMSPMYDPTI
jgi:hypothetical protein